MALYLVNLALLATRQIDAAYWREWDLLHLPGGIQRNLLLHLIANLKQPCGSR